MFLDEFFFAIWMKVYLTSPTIPPLINPNSEESSESTLFGVGGQKLENSTQQQQERAHTRFNEHTLTNQATVQRTHMTYSCAPRQAPTHTSTKPLTYLSLRSF